MLTGSALIIFFTFSQFLTTHGSSVKLSPKQIDDWRKKQDISVLMLIKKSCSDYDKRVKELDDLSDIFGNMVSFGMLDSEAEGVPSSLKSSKCPTIKIFEKSLDKPKNYEKTVSVEEISSYVVNLIDKIVKERFSKKGYTKKDTYVVTLADSNFTQTVTNSDEHWLVEFYAPWCGHCKALAPAWKEAAKRLDGKMKLAAVDATVNKALAELYMIKGFPTIKFIPARSQKPESSVLDYNGGRSADDIVSWAETKVKAFRPPPELTQVNSHTQLDENCLSKMLCVLAFLPNKLDSSSSEWNGYISILKEVNSKVLRDDSNGWVWVEGTVYEDLEEAVGVGGFGYPALVILRPSKNAYSPLKGPFTVVGIKDFINSLGTRSVSTFPLSKEIPMIKDTKSWDGSAFGNAEL